MMRNCRRAWSPLEHVPKNWKALWDLPPRDGSADDGLDQHLVVELGGGCFVVKGVARRTME